MQVMMNDCVINTFSGENTLALNSSVHATEVSRINEGVFLGTSSNGGKETNMQQTGTIDYLKYLANFKRAHAILVSVCESPYRFESFFTRVLEEILAAGSPQRLLVSVFI